MKVLLAVVAITGLSIVPASAQSVPNLKGYVCVDQHGIHHMWQEAFNGTTFCKLVPNPVKR